MILNIFRWTKLWTRKSTTAEKFISFRRKLATSTSSGKSRSSRRSHKQIYHSITTLHSNKAIWLVKRSRVTWDIQSVCFFSALHCYITQKFVYDTGSRSLLSEVTVHNHWAQSPSLWSDFNLSVIQPSHWPLKDILFLIMFYFYFCDFPTFTNNTNLQIINNSGFFVLISSSSKSSWV